MSIQLTCDKYTFASYVPTKKVVRECYIYNKRKFIKKISLTEARELVHDNKAKWIDYNKYTLELIQSEIVKISDLEEKDDKISNVDYKPAQPIQTMQHIDKSIVIKTAIKQFIITMLGVFILIPLAFVALPIVIVLIGAIGYCATWGGRYYYRRRHFWF